MMDVVIILICAAVFVHGVWKDIEKWIWGF
jgi:hypothetical protein